MGAWHAGAGRGAARGLLTSRLTRPLSPVALAGLILGGVTALWFRFNAAPPRNGSLFPHDLLNYFYPLGQQVASRLASGQWPLWNPHACSGVPLLAAAQVAVVYPATWLTLLLPLHQALPLRIFVECALGGWFTALLLRAWCLDTVAAAAGGILFVHACLIGQTFWPPEVSTLIWYPWLLLCAEKLLGPGRWRWGWWYALALGTAAQILAGFPQFVVYTLHVLVPFAGWRLVRLLTGSGRWAPAAMRGTGVLLAVGLGVALSSVQLLPTLELVAESPRAQQLGAGTVHYHPGAPAGTFLRNAANPSPKLPSFDHGKGGGYVGISTVLLAILGALAGPRRRLVWLAIAVAGVTLALSDGYRGVAASAYGWFARVTAAGLFRNSERLRLLTLSAIIAAAAVGLDEIGRGLRLRRGIDGGWQWIGGALAAGGVLVALGGEAVAWRVGLTLALLLGAACWAEHRTVRRACQVMILFALAGDVTYATGPFGSLRAFPKNWAETFHAWGFAVLDDAAAARLQREAGLARVELQGFQPYMRVPSEGNAYRVSCYETLVPKAWALLLRRMGGHPMWNRLFMNVDQHQSGAFYDLAGVRLVVSPHLEIPTGWDRQEALRDLLDTLQTFHATYASGNAPSVPPPPWIRVEWWTNEDALPRAYLASRYALVSLNQALDHVAKGDIDFRRTVLLERHPGILPAGAAGVHVPATIAAYAPERVEIHVDAPTQGLLVLSDTDYPGWRAWLDGEATEILRANGLYRAIVVPPGRHRAVFQYEPRSFTLGSRISLASLALVVLVPMAASWGRGRLTATEI